MVEDTDKRPFIINKVNVLQKKKRRKKFSLKIIVPELQQVEVKSVPGVDVGKECSATALKYTVGIYF